MKRDLFGLAALGVATALLAGCTDDPTASLVGNVERVATSVALVELIPGDSALISARTLDAQGNPLTQLPEVSSGDAAVATVRVDEATTGQPLPQTNFFVVGVDAGATAVTATAGGVSTEVPVIVFPVTFGGAMSVNSAGRVDTLTISSTAIIAFDETSSSVLVNGAPVDVVSRSATELKAVVSNKGAVAGATVTVTDLTFLDTIEVAALDGRDPVDFTGDGDEPANDATSTPTSMALNTTERASISASDVNDYWLITVTTAGDYEFTLEFPGTGGDPDADLIVREHATGTLAGFAASLANPETTTITLAPGDYRLQVNLYDGGGAPEPYWYRLTVTGP